jgi:hypothetical protein
LIEGEKESKREATVRGKEKPHGLRKSRAVKIF